MAEYNIPENLKYVKSHEWAQKEGDLVVIGITDYAQKMLKDVVYVELPEVGETVEKDKEFGSIESVKSVSDLFSPISGEVVEVNSELEDAPEKVNEDPYQAWMIKVRPSNLDAEWDELMSAEEYRNYIKELEEE